MKKRNVILLVLLLVIGFASVSTSLILNGKVGIGTKDDDFDVIFISATLNGEESSNVMISENKKSITFTSERLRELNEKAVLDYKVKNNSTQYGADVTISCNTKGNDYISITGEFADESLPITTPILMDAQEIKEGYISAELVHVYSGEDASISITCEIIGNATSRDAYAYTIDFDSNGGSEVQEIVVTKNETYGELPIPEREGYVFKGWYNDADEKIDNDTIVDIDKNETIHAKWDITLTKYVNELAKSDTTNLAYDNTADNNLRYIGSNPNNYVLFNGELWRIIGVMNNIIDSDGNNASHIKIVRNSSIGDIAWASNNVNNWAASSLQTLLNSGDYFKKTGSYSSVGLTDEYKNKISNVVWNLAGYSFDATASQMYSYERGTTVYSGRPATWTGKVGLIYPSDFGFAVGGSVRDTCLSASMGPSYSSCVSDDWIYISNAYQWTITAKPNSASSVHVLFNDSRLNDKDSNRAYGVRPVVYLNTNIIKVSGSGSTTDPFVIE